MIEAVERNDKDFAVGLQFHPEAAIVKTIEDVDNAEELFPYGDALKFFTRLVAEAKER